jgi:3-hydroxybutyrate dehydrogenase
VNKNAPLAGRSAIVTGGASGIGQAVAMALAEAGAAIAIGSLLADGDDPGALTHLPTRDDLRGVEASIAALGVDCYAGPLDVRSRDSVESFYSEATDRLGAVGVLVNAAGIGGSEPIAEHDEQAWLATIDVNLTGAFRTIRACLPAMMEQRWGRIVNIASTAASVGYPGLGAYCASKAGLLGLTRCVALEGAPFGISCNAISPGQVDTPTTRMSFELWKEREGIEQTQESYNTEWAGTSPQGRMIEAEDIATLAVFLCTDRAFGISTENITVSGGALW